MEGSENSNWAGEDVPNEKGVWGEGVGEVSAGVTGKETDFVLTGVLGQPPMVGGVLGMDSCGREGRVS